MNAAVNMQAVAPQPSQSVRSMFGAQSEQLVSGDAFAMLLMQLAGTDGEAGFGEFLGGAAQADNALLAALLQGDAGLPTDGQTLLGLDETDDLTALLPFMQNTRRQTEKEGVQNAMEMVAEILAFMQTDPAVAQIKPEQVVAAAQTNPMAAIPGELLVDDLVKPEAAPVRRESDEVPLMSFERVLTEVAPAEQDTVTAFPVEQMQYSSAVRQVQRTLKDATDTEKAEVIDVEALQADVDIGRFIPDTAKVKAELPVPESAENVVKQLRTGIIENLGNKEAFVIKLKPEGLGEITIKMADDDGKIVLSIQTTNPQVTRLLNAEVSSLQNALRPLQAEVREIVTAPDYAAAGQFANAGQQFGSGRPFHEQYQSDQPYYAFDHTGEQAIDSVETILRQDSALDAYI